MYATYIQDTWPVEYVGWLVWWLVGTCNVICMILFCIHMWTESVESATVDEAEVLLVTQSASEARASENSMAIKGAEVLLVTRIHRKPHQIS